MTDHGFSRWRQLLCLAAGALAFAFIGWRTNMALAAFVAPPLLMAFFRAERRLGLALLAWPLLALASLPAMWGGWDLPALAYVAFSFVRPLPLVLALLADRFARKRLPPLTSTLVFPSTLVALDWLLSLSPLATVLSPIAGSFALREFAQGASLFGLWGLGFAAWWLAPALNGAAEAKWSLREAGAAFILPVAVLGGALAFGALRLGLHDFARPTVRVGGISVAHPRDYWNLIDAGTPREASIAIRAEAKGIEDALFEGSARAAAAGARILLWSEGACVLDEETEAAFVERATAFCRDKGVYLAAAVLTLHFGSSLSDNKVLMFTPEGGLAFSYVKTISWYPTGSDGILKTVDTPWGKVGAAICFDMDTPSFARRLARLGAGLVLVPSYDSAGIKPFHTEVGLFRAIEGGYSIFRMVAEGTSMAVDGLGVVRGYQDYFATKDRVMLADLPLAREACLYPFVGDLLAWLSALLALALSLAAFLRGRPRGGASVAA